MSEDDAAILRRVKDEAIELITERLPLTPGARIAWFEGQRDLLDYLLTGRRTRGR